MRDACLLRFCRRPSEMQAGPFDLG